MKENLGKFLKNILPPASVERLKGVRDIAHLGRTVSDLQGKFLREQYPGLVACEDERTYLALNEYKAFSQYGEDGLLLYIFSQIGIANFSFVEIGIGTGRECNTAALSIYFGWHGLLIDGDADNVKLARAHYGACLGRETERVKVAPGFVTTENVNEIITQHGMAGEIDLLSIDIDGNDYWVWQAIEAVEPRTVVIEYNASFGPEKAITVPYDPAFNRHDKHPSGIYHGASLAALANLGKARGYRLVGCESHGVNAFFIRGNLAKDTLPEITPGEAYYPHAERCKKITTEEQFEIVKAMPFDTIGEPAE